MERERRPAGVTLLAWGMIVLAVGAIGLSATVQVLGTLGGQLALGLDIRVLGLMLLVLIGVVWPARAWMAGEKWAWFLTSLYAVGAIAVSSYLAFRVVRGYDATADQAAWYVGLYLSVALAFSCLVTGGIAFLFLQSGKVRDFFRVQGAQRWLAPVAALLIAGGAVAYLQASSNRAEAAANLVRLREMAARRSSDDESLALMLDRLAEGNQEERFNAAYALGRSGRSEATGPLIEAALRDRAENVRANAVQGLAELRAEGRAQVFVDLLADESALVRRTALGKLASPEFADRAAEVMPLLQHEETETRAAAADVLGILARPESVPALIATTQDAEEEVRSRSAFALGKIRDPRAEAALLAMLDDAEWAARANAAQALGMLGAASARPQLERLRDDDPNSQVRIAAENALDRLAF